MRQFLPGRSYLVVGKIRPTDLTAVLPVDRLEINAEELDVKALRQAIATFYQRPYGSQRLVVIKSADELSIIHQNTLLKVLEEPPATLTIVLEVRSAEPLLPTVRSRLEVLNGAATDKEVASILAQSETETAKTLQAAKDRSGLTGLLKQELRWQLQNLATLANPNRLGALEQAITRLERNCNQKLVIDRFLLQYFNETGKA